MQKKINSKKSLKQKNKKLKTLNYKIKGMIKHNN